MSDDKERAHALEMGGAEGLQKNFGEVTLALEYILQ